MLLGVAQVGGMVLALLSEPRDAEAIRLVSLLHEAVLVMAVLVVRCLWFGGDPFGLPAMGSLGLLLAIGLNGLYLRWMLHHSLAHKTMGANYAEVVARHRVEVQEDLRSGLLDEESARRRETQVGEEQQCVASICGLGQQAGGMALLQMGCLILASNLQPSAELWVGWTLGISLAGLINSKTQDVLLSRYLPCESRLC